MRLIITDSRSFDLKETIKFLGFKWSVSRRRWIKHTTNSEKIESTKVLLNQYNIQFIQVERLPELTKNQTKKKELDINNIYFLCTGKRPGKKIKITNEIELKNYFLEGIRTCTDLCNE